MREHAEATRESESGGTTRVEEPVRGGVSPRASSRSAACLLVELVAGKLGLVLLHGHHQLRLQHHTARLFHGRHLRIQLIRVALFRREQRLLVSSLLLLQCPRVVVVRARQCLRVPRQCGGMGLRGGPRAGPRAWSEEAMHRERGDGRETGEGSAEGTRRGKEGEAEAAGSGARERGMR